VIEVNAFVTGSRVTARPTPFASVPSSLKSNEYRRNNQRRIPSRNGGARVQRRLLPQRAKCQFNADIYVLYPNQAGLSRLEGL
jgi:hypothetical protein